MAKSSKVHASGQHFTYWVDLSEMSENGAEIILTATEEQAADIAARLGVEAVNHLAITAQIDHPRQKIVLLSGQVEAEIVQNCVVTLEPITTQIDEPFFIQLAKGGEGKKGENVTNVAPHAESEEDIEFINGESFDLADLALQYLSLALDPYPRKEGAIFTPISRGDASESEEAGPSLNPFAKLKDYFGSLAPDGPETGKKPPKSGK